MLVCASCNQNVQTLPEASFDDIPRWRGFNLLEKFQNAPDEFSDLAPVWSYYNEPFREEDFHIIQELGFNFVRLPMSYKCWINGDNLLDFNEKALKEIDQAVEWGKKYQIHVSICMHRAPGYCVAGRPAEKYDLWTDEYIQDVFATHWAMFARRYKGISNKYVSFDLVNEPITTEERYEKVIRKAVKAIRDVDPDRLIIADGIDCGSRVMPGVDDLNLVQSGRGYTPVFLTHYKATWTQWWAHSPEEDVKTLPTWPYTDAWGTTWNKETFEQYYKPWFDYREQTGHGIHIGECGVYKYTPHDVTLGFFSDLLSTLKEHNVGWALWQLRGVNGILDSERDDVIYEPYRGHKLDRKLLEILQAN